MYEGKGKFVEQDFTFSGPIKMMKMQYELGQMYNEVLKIEQNHFKLKEWLFETASGDLKIEGADLSDDQK